MIRGLLNPFRRCLPRAGISLRPESLLCYNSPAAPDGATGAHHAEQVVNSVGSDRTEVVAHYIIARADPNKLGAVKLNKVMWFADLEAYRRLGRTVTGQDSYEKRQYGPVPNNIVRSIRRLEQADKIATRDVPTFGGTRREYVWLKKPDVAEFSAEEVDILNEAIDWVCDSHTAKSISHLSHDALWEAAELGEQIPVGAATVISDELGGDDIQWALDALQSAAE
jgi:hypothetical protein